MEIRLCASTHFTKGYVVLYSLFGESGHQCEDAPERLPMGGAVSSEDWHSGQQLTATTAKLRCSHISATPRTSVIIKTLVVLKVNLE